MKNYALCNCVCDEKICNDNSNSNNINRDRVCDNMKIMMVVIIDGDNDTPVTKNFDISRSNKR